MGLKYGFQNTCKTGRSRMELRLGGATYEAPKQRELSGLRGNSVLQAGLGQNPGLKSRS